MATRRERVILDLEDRFTSPMLRAAAAAKTLDKSLNDLDGSTVRTDRDMDRLGSSSGSLSKAATQSRTVSKEVDRMSGRMRLLADAALLLGPALVPIGAVAVPAMIGLAAQAGAAAVGVGTMVVAFQGVGTTLEAVNKAALEPTAENLAAARIAMQQLGPEAQNLVRQVQEMRPAFQALRNAAAAGLFPGLSAALDDMERVFPNLERILFRVGDAAGDLGAELGDALAGPRGREFLDFIAAEVPRALTDLGHIAGNLAGGMAELWRAFTPVNNDFSRWLVDASRAFDDWAQGLSQTQGFNDFVAYIRENGPRVADALGSIGNAVLQIVEAAAPLGGPALAALTAFADVVSAIADSSYGPALLAVASGMTLISRASKALTAIKGSTLFTDLAAASSGAATSIGRVQGAGIAAAAGITAAVVAGNALVDLFREDLPGVEQLTGMLMDLSAGSSGSLPSEFNSLADSVERITNPSFWKQQQTSDFVTGLFGSQGRSLTNATDEVEALEAALTNLVGLQGPQAAETALAKVADNAGLTADQVARLRDLMPGYQDALAGAANQAAVTGDKSSAAARRAAQGFEQATSAAQRFKNAIEAANRVLTARAGAVAYEQAVDDLTKAIRQNGKTLDINTQKGRDNRSALDAVAASAVNMAKDMNRTNGIKVLTQARQDIVDAAMKLGKTRGEAQSLADRLLGLNGVHAEPSVDLDASGFFSTAARVGSELGSLAGRAVTTYVNTVHRSIKGNADGGTVGGPRQPYGDKVLTYLAPGEEVISNRYGQADRHREVLRAINANRLGNGGTVVDAINRASSHWSPGAASVSVGSPNVNVAPQVRVFIGDRELEDVAVSVVEDYRHHDSRPATRWAGVSRD